MAVLLRLPLLAHQPLSICLGLAACFLQTMACSLASISGDGLISVAFHLGCVITGISDAVAVVPSGSSYQC